MPTASREGSRSRRSNSKAKSPPPQKAPPAPKKVNGLKNNPTPKSTPAPKGNGSSSKSPKDPQLYDLYADTECKLCEKKNFKPGTDALLKHYALEDFKEKLEVDITTNGKDFFCNLCKSKKLKSKFESRQEILMHLVTFHFKAQYLLAEALGEKSSGTSDNVSNNTRRTRNRDRGKQTGPGPGKSEDMSNDSVIEIESSSGSSDVSQNGLEELSKSSDVSDKSTDPEEEIVEEIVDEDEEEDDVIEFNPSSIDTNKSSSAAKSDPIKSSEKADLPQETKRKETWIRDKKSKTKNETWIVNKECSNNKSTPSDEVIEVIDLDEEEGDNDSGNDTETESQDSDSKSITVLGGAQKNHKHDPFPTPRTLEEFQQALKEHLRTKDGAYCIAKDEKNIECVCGKVIKVCNSFYWKYMVQKPRIQNGKIVSRGHWFNCDEVKRRGTDFVMDPEELEELKQILASGVTNQSLKRPESGDRTEDHKPKRMRTRDKKEEVTEDDDAEARMMIIQRNIAEILESRVVNETFIQDGPCFLAASDLAWCRECRNTPATERQEILLSGKFTEADSNITCSFYSFRKLRMTKGGELVVAGYLNPQTDPKPEEIALFQPDKTRASLDVAKTKYILSLIGDQFCQMVQQERRCLSVHLGANKTVAWKRSVRGVREMCDICKTTIFNYHWMCSTCGLFVCLDCYQNRRSGLVKDVADKTTDDYNWPYCSGRSVHQMSQLMLTAIIPANCLIDLAKKLHSLRHRWKIPQFCHQSDELRTLYTQDDGFLNLQSASLGSSSGRQVFYPCSLCNVEAFRWQSDLYKHYATQHFSEELLAQLGLEAGSSAPFRCSACAVTTDTEQQILIHCGLSHRGVQKLLEKSGAGQNALTHRLPGLGSSDAPSTYKCQICSSLMSSKHRSDHLIVHFKDKISPLLAKTAPFNCPKCRFVAMDRSTLIRHFATRHGLVEAFLKDWLERHGRSDEASSLVVPVLPEIKPPPENDVPECRLCEDFPVFFKNFDFHKHLADVHFRTQLNNNLPQSAPFKCPVEGCPYDTKVRHNLIVHYGVTHRNVFKLLNSTMGGSSEAGAENSLSRQMSGHLGHHHGGPEPGRGRGGGRGRAGGAGGRSGGRAGGVSSMEACLVCEEMVSKETMVFHLAHKHFQDKISHLPQQRPFKCPDCNHVNEFQGGLVKHYGSHHGVFNRSLKDMGLLDAREDLSRTGVKFPRPKIERVFTSGPGNNVALELARTAAIWSGGMKEEEEVLQEVLALRELGRSVDAVVQNPENVKKEPEEKKDPVETVKVKQEPVDPQDVTINGPSDIMTNSCSSVEVKKEPGENNVELEPKRELVDEDVTECQLCDNVPKMLNKSELLRHLVEKHFKQKMYAKLIYQPPKTPDPKIKTEEGVTPTLRGTYKCPQCDFENCNQMNTARHYGIKHRFAHKMYEEILCRPVFGPGVTKEGTVDRRTVRGRPPTGSQIPTKQEVGERCKICQVEQESPATYQRHLIKVHFKAKLLEDCPRSKPFVCPNEGCDIERRDRFNLLMHYGGCQKKVWKLLEELPEGSIQTLDESSKSKCKICGKYFTSARYMWTHMGDEHFEKELNAELPTEAPWKCPKCPQDSAYTGSDLRTLRVHYGTRHKAVMPHLAAKMNISLKDLQAEFRPSNETGKTCQFCHKSFFNQMDFLKHSLLHVRKRVYQDLPESEPFLCPRCPFTGNTRIALLLHYGLQHNVVSELLKENPATLMVDMDFIVKKNGFGEEEKLNAVSDKAAGLPSSIHPVEKYPELDNKRFPKCKLCSYRYFTKLDLFRHFADHHLREQLCAVLGPDPGQYAAHKCPEPGCFKELKTRQAAWRHYGSAHGHLLKMMVAEYNFKLEEWPLPMKDSDLTKLCTERRKAISDHQGLVARHEEAARAHQERLGLYHQELARHQAMVQQAQREAYQHNQDAMAAQMSGQPYQPPPNPLASLPPQPVAPVAPAPPPPAPQPLKPLEDPSNMDLGALPTLEWLENTKVAQNVCELCGEEFINTNKTRDKGNHQVNHFRDMILQSLNSPAHRFECPRCSFVGRDRNALLKHYGLSHRVVVSLVRKEMGGLTATEVSEVTHDCKVCSQFFLNQNALNNHLCDSHYGPRLSKDVPFTPNPPYKCPKCNYEAKTHQMTVRHYGVKHGLLRQFMIEDGYVARDPTPPPPPTPATPTRPAPPPYPEMNINRTMMTGHMTSPSQPIPIPGGYRGQTSGTPHHSPYSRSPSQTPQFGSPNQSWIDHYMSPGASPGHGKPDDVHITCPIQSCSSVCANPQILMRHVTDKHFADRFARELPQAPPFHCPLCNHNFPDQITLIRHWGISHKMVLKVLNENMGRPNCYDIAVLKQFEVQGVRENCPLCKGTFQGRQLLLRHLCDTHFKDRMCNGIPDQEGLIYKCPQCNHVARDRQSFVRHYGIVHKMVVKYLNEMGIHNLDDEHRNSSAPPSPATPRAVQFNPNDSFSPRSYQEPMRSPGYFSPHHTPHRSPSYAGGYNNSTDASGQASNSFNNHYTSPQQQYGSTPPHYSGNSITSPQQQQQYPQQPRTPQQQLPPPQAYPQTPGYPGQQTQTPASPQYQQKPLHVLVSDPYRAPPTPGSNPGTPQPLSQPGTPQPLSVPASPAGYRQSVAPMTPQYPQTPGTSNGYPQQQHQQQAQMVPQQQVVQAQQPVQAPQQQQQPTPAKKVSEYVPTGDENIQPPAPNTKGPYGIFCVHCNSVKARQPSDFYRHLAETHYKSYLTQFLPPPGNPPYKCPLCPYENKEMSPMIRHFGVAHKKVKEAIGSEIVGRYIPESEMSPSRPGKSQYNPQQQQQQQQFELTGSSQEPSSQVSVKCPYPDCEMEFTARYAFWQHMCDKHLKEELLKYIPLVPNQPYHCPFQNCNYVTKDSRQALVRHYGMTHKVVHGILGQKFPEFLNNDPFAQSPKVVARSKPVMQQQQYPQQVQPQQQHQHHPQAQQYIEHQGQPHIQRVQHIQHYQQRHPQQQQFNGYHQQQPQQQQQQMNFVQQQQQQPVQQQMFQTNSQFDNLDSLNLDNLNPSDFNIPSLSEFLDNPSASFPNLSGEDLSNAGYVTAAGTAHAHPNMQTMQFEPQMDGTFDPTSITDQSLDGSAGSNPTTPEKNKNTISPATTPQRPERPESATTSKKCVGPSKKFCEICGKEYEGKNKSMNKVQHMIHHFKEQLYKSLPAKSEEGLPYKCPEEGCKFETKHKPDWARHYGSVHKVVERLLRDYLETHPEAWANQPENQEIVREQSAGPAGQGASSSVTQPLTPKPPTPQPPSTPQPLTPQPSFVGGQPASQPSQPPTPQPQVVARPGSIPGSTGASSDQLDAGEGLLCKLTDLQQKIVPSTAMTLASTGHTGAQVTSLAGGQLQPLVVNTASSAGLTGPGRLSVELPKSDLTKFITTALTEKNVPHASTATTDATSEVEESTPSTSGLSQQQIMEQKVQNVIHEQQQILDNQKTEKTEPTPALPSISQPGPMKQPSFTLPQQPVPVSSIGSAISSTKSPVKLPPETGSLQQLLQGSGGKNIIIRDPKTGQQHLVVQTPQGGQQTVLLQKNQQLQQHQQQSQQQQYLVQTKDGQIIQVQGQPKPSEAGQPPQQIVVQTSSGQQMVLNSSQIKQQQQQPGTKIVQVESNQQGQVIQQQTQQQPPLQGQLSGQQSGHQPGQPQGQQQGQPQGQQIIQSKIVQHNGRTYLVQVRAQKPIEPGKQIIVKTNQPGFGGTGLVQEVMDEVIRQQYQKTQEQQKISNLAMQLEQQTQQHLSQQAQKSPMKATPPPVSPGIKLTQQQQQLLLPTEPHPQIAAQHQMKQQQQQQQQQTPKATSILQQQLELPMNHGTKGGVVVTPGGSGVVKTKVNSPVQCFLCQEMPWFPNQEHLDNHYSSAHGIMPNADSENDLDIQLSNADLEASLSSMNDVGDAGDFESLLDALPPSPEPQDIPDPQNMSSTSASEPIRKKTAVTNLVSNSRMCELCGFEPKTKNKSRERMDHLAMKHFRDQMISELRKDKPMKCPRCEVFESKDRQQLFRHMISKHKVLDHYLLAAIQKMRSEGREPFGGATSAAASAAASAVTLTPGSEQSTSAVVMNQQPSTTISPVAQTLASLTPALPPGLSINNQPTTPASVSQPTLMMTPALPPGLSIAPVSQSGLSITPSGHSGLSIAPVSSQSRTSITPVTIPIIQKQSVTRISLNPKSETSITPETQSEASNVAPTNEKTEMETTPNDSETEPMETSSTEEGGEEKKPEGDSDKIMQVDGADDCSSDCSSEAGDCTELSILQMDGAGDEEDTASSTGIDPGEDESEFFLEESKGRDRSARMACPICKEEMKFSKTYHFATTHFRPRLQRVLPTKKPFVCPDCGEEQQHKINLWSHYIGRAHKHLETWLEEYQKAEVKPDWCDPSPANPRANRRLGSSSTASVASPRSPLVTSSLASVSSPSVPVEKPAPSTPSSKEWFCDLCHGMVPQRREIHFASLHFKEKLKAMLPTQAPFICPDLSCKAEHKHFLNLSTHFLTQHGYLKSWLEERGIAYEPSKRSKAERQVSSLQTLQTLQTQEIDIKEDFGDDLIKDTNEFGKHHLSSSESESDNEEGKDCREDILEKPVRSGFEQSLAFLSGNIIKTESGAKEIIDKEKSEGKSKRKRVKRQLEYDLLDVVKTMTDGECDSLSHISRDPPPARVMTSALMAAYEQPPHAWLCDGRLLMLADNLHEANIKIFQDQWRRGQPVMVANVSNKLDMNLWSPDAFNKEFGDLKHDIINCKTHKKIPQIPLKWFWDGFENLKSRLLDQQGMPMLLKLKDWPTEDDFAQYFPKRFADLMVHLPLSDYTRREGQYNLASYMPDYFLQPDLGPKMYIAYGSPLYPEYGSTNLHMDMSDAVNLMVYVGIPQDGNNDETVREGFKAVDEAGCDVAMKDRIRREGLRIGALWHIFHPRDADKIRDFLNKVTMEKGHKLEPHNDPIHDQSVYLTSHLRQRLFEEYGVEGYAIAQCEGDTIFIPAGAPHQVRNIHNCIKVAEDFVSPENLESCFLQTEEFKQLSESHTNHEDKLQIKNILYHAVKECVAVLENYEMNNNGRTC